MHFNHVNMNVHVVINQLFLMIDRMKPILIIQKFKQLVSMGVHAPRRLIKKNIATKYQSLATLQLLETIQECLV